MASYRDTATMFARLDVIERLLEIRAELGYPPAIFLFSAAGIADYMDAFGFDAVAVPGIRSNDCSTFRAPLAPCGDLAHTSRRSH
jgi:hypothetical protein